MLCMNHIWRDDNEILHRYENGEVLTSEPEVIKLTLEFSTTSRDISEQYLRSLDPETCQPATVVLL